MHSGEWLSNLMKQREVNTMGHINHDLPIYICCIAEMRAERPTLIEIHYASLSFRIILYVVKI